MTPVTTKKERIFIEAAKLFQTKGYAATSMRELAEKVGLKPSSFYSHIKSKEEILEKICNNAAQRFHSGLQEVQEKWDTPYAQFEGVIDLHITVAFEDPSAITVFNDEWRQLSGTALKEFRLQRKGYQDKVIQIIKACIAENELKEFDPNIVFNTLIGGTRWLHFLNEPSETLQIKMRDQIKSMLIDGMK